MDIYRIKMLQCATPGMHAVLFGYWYLSKISTVYLSAALWWVWTKAVKCQHFDGNCSTYKRTNCRSVCCTVMICVQSVQLLIAYICVLHCDGISASISSNPLSVDCIVTIFMQCTTTNINCLCAALWWYLCKV